VNCAAHATARIPASQLLVIPVRPGRPARIQTAILRLGHAPGQRHASRAVRAGWIGSKRSAPGPAGWTYGPGAIGPAPQPRSPPPRCCEQTAPPAHHRAGSRSFEEIPIAGPGGAALGKHLLERAGGAARNSWCDASVRTRSWQGPSQGGPVRCRPWWRRSTAAGLAESELRRGAPLRRLIGPGPPSSRCRLTGLLGCARTTWWWAAKLHPTR